MFQNTLCEDDFLLSCTRSVWLVSFGPVVVNLGPDELLTSRKLFGQLFTFQKTGSGNPRDSVTDIGTLLEAPPRDNMPLDFSNASGLK